MSEEESDPMKGLEQFEDGVWEKTQGGILIELAVKDFQWMLAGFGGLQVGNTIMWGVARVTTTDGVALWKAVFKDGTSNKAVYSMMTHPTRELAAIYCQVMRDALGEVLTAMGVNWHETGNN